MAVDVFLTFFGHPILPTGYNSAPNDGDEVDGAGYNEPVWPVRFDTFEAMKTMFITDEMREFFETACPDYIAPCVPNTIVFPTEERELDIRRRA